MCKRNDNKMNNFSFQFNSFEYFLWRGWVGRTKSQKELFQFLVFPHKFDSIKTINYYYFFNSKSGWATRNPNSAYTVVTVPFCLLLLNNRYYSKIDWLLDNCQHIQVHKHLLHIFMIKLDDDHDYYYVLLTSKVSITIQKLLNSLNVNFN